MTEENWKLEKDLCRCCHNEGAFKNLAEPFCNQGEEEIYSEMLIKCLDINLTPVAGPLCTVTYTICEGCVLRLRDACSFKRQVLQCEQRFQDLYSKNVIKLDTCYDIDIKVEAPDIINEELKEEDNLDDDVTNDNGCDDYHSDLDLAKEDNKTVKTKKPKEKMKKKKAGRPRKVKPELEGDTDGREKRKRGVKFRLNELDYRRDAAGYQCARCDKRYDKVFSLKFHVKTKHYRIPRYKCTYCDEEFMTPAPLTVHKLEVHNVDDRFKCNACNCSFNTKVQLRKHINNYHMMGEKYKCDLCDYESFSFEGMYKHKFKHKTVKDYHCRFCKKAFLRKTTLDLHERIHTGDRRKVCNVCGKAFVQKASLNYHMAKYHPEVNY